MTRQIQWDNNLRITGMVLNPVNPRVEHDLQYSNKRIVFNRGDGYWQGSVTFGVVKDTDKVAAIESFFTALNEGDCYTLLPIAEVKGASDGSARVRTIAGNSITLEGDKDIKLGSFWYHADKEQVARAVVKDGVNLIMQPNISWQVGDDIAAANHIRVRLNNAVNLSVTPHWAGGWTMTFTEWRS